MTNEATLGRFALRWVSGFLAVVLVWALTRGGAEEGSSPVDGAERTESTDRADHTVGEPGATGEAESLRVEDRTPTSGLRATPEHGGETAPAAPPPVVPTILWGSLVWHPSMRASDFEVAYRTPTSATPRSIPLQSGGEFRLMARTAPVSLDVTVTLREWSEVVFECRGIVPRPGSTEPDPRLLAVDLSAIRRNLLEFETATGAEPQHIVHIQGLGLDGEPAWHITTGITPRRSVVTLRRGQVADVWAFGFLPQRIDLDRADPVRLVAAPTLEVRLDLQDVEVPDRLGPGGIGVRVEGVDSKLAVCAEFGERRADLRRLTLSAVRESPASQMALGGSHPVVPVSPAVGYLAKGPKVAQFVLMRPSRLTFWWTLRDQSATAVIEQNCDPLEGDRIFNLVVPEAEARRVIAAAQARHDLLRSR